MRATEGYFTGPLEARLQDQQPGHFIPADPVGMPQILCHLVAVARANVWKTARPPRGKMALTHENGALSDLYIFAQIMSGDIGRID